MTRVIRAAGWTSIIAGVLILGFVVQQLFVTTWFAEQHQEALEEEALEHFAIVEVSEEAYVPPARPTDRRVGDHRRWCRWSTNEMTYRLG